MIAVLSKMSVVVHTFLSAMGRILAGVEIEDQLSFSFPFQEGIDAPLEHTVQSMKSLPVTQDFVFKS